MTDDLPTIMSACGRIVGPEEIRHAQKLIKICSGLSRTELELTLCEHWNWVGPTGKLQQRACKKVLSRLEQQGILELPAKRGSGPGPTRSTKIDVDERETAPRVLVESALKALRPVHLERVVGRPETNLCNAFIERYHFLGYKNPFGLTLRYFITSNRGRLGCLLVSSGARAISCRDEWIGWTAQSRLSNLPFVINNSRFLLFPWVRVPHLASHVLGQLVRQIRKDWHQRWNYSPVLMETFVDPTKHRGICYRAAGWKVLGRTTGNGLRLRGHNYKTNPKLILVRPLVDDFREQLLSKP